MKTINLFSMALLGVVLSCLPALAQSPTDTHVSLPVGDWLTALGEWIAPLVGIAALWLIRKLPAQIAGILMTMRADQLLEKAVAYALNAVQGAAKGKSLDFSTGSKVADEALQYVVTNAPGWLISWLGGPDAIRQKIVARIDVAPEVSLR